MPPARMWRTCAHAIVSGIRHVEESTRRFVADNPYIIDHYAEKP